MSGAAAAGSLGASPAAKTLAWSVHAFTALGGVLGVFALPAVARGDYRTAFLCMLGTLAVDAVDGTLARAARVQEVLPDFDGKMLDYVYDFQNFVIIPAFIVLQGRIVDERLAVPCVVAVLLVSSYHYGNTKAVTPDHYFLGFPAFWNVVVFYLCILELDPWWNLSVLALFCLLHFVPIKFLYVSRTRRLRGLNVSVCAAGAASALGVTLLLPAPPRWLVLFSAGCAASVVLASVGHTVVFPKGRA